MPTSDVMNSAAKPSGTLRSRSFGNSAATTEPRKPASSISGTVVQTMNQRFFAKSMMKRNTACTGPSRAGGAAESGRLHWMRSAAATCNSLEGRKRHRIGTASKMTNRLSAILATAM